MIAIDELLTAMRNSELAGWARLLPGQIAKGMDVKRYGDLPRWYKALESLPKIQSGFVEIERGCLRVGRGSDLDETGRKRLEDTLKKLHPWRKGPYDLFGVHIDTEWRSDWKWDRLKDHIEPLGGRLVLDVGCGNGYHCWRMYMDGARRVIGIDPTPLFVMQFEALRHFIGQAPVNVLPLGIDDVPVGLAAFDTVFSMGVMYHRRSPLDHLLQLHGCLKPGGELVLETLVVEGDENTLLVPADRYARMANVWFIPSVEQLCIWLKRCKFTDVRVVDVTATSTDEQRATEWMTFQSLADFLDADDPRRTVEGYPAPLRAIIVAHRK